METMSDFEGNSPKNFEMAVPAALTLPAVYVDSLAGSMKWESKRKRNLLFQ